ncbi:ribonuclease H family protein [Falsirhodobacter xinxiangensis]|uniref:ribonuclease H family protein n=1 Tax=Falsirhodobacter xinxiangensis TaxID=2530049 RepID=UPI0010AA6665|nr:ribonuclease H [Rhodobacter xinxiangensis]
MQDTSTTQKPTALLSFIRGAETSRGYDDNSPDTAITAINVSEHTEASATRIAIYTDGSALGNPGPGGWAALLLRLDADDKVIKKVAISGSGKFITTNIKMEMTAVAEALKALGPPTAERVAVYADLEMISKGVNEWLPGWKARGWRNSAKKPVENTDLWKDIEAAAAGWNVSWRWVRSHVGHQFNEEADALAKQAAALAASSGVTFADT